MHGREGVKGCVGKRTKEAHAFMWNKRYCGEERPRPGIILIEQLECNGFSWWFLFEVFMCAQADLESH